MKLMIIGDVHGYFTSLNTLINRHRPNIIIACGDFGYWPKFKQYSLDIIKPQYTQIYFVDGNHEDHEALAAFTKPTEIVKNVTYMPRGTIQRFPIIGNTLFIGGASSIDQDWRTPGHDWFPEEVITTKDLDKIRTDKKIDTIISHTRPTSIEIGTRVRIPSYKWPKFNDSSSLALEILLNTYEPSNWFFGHWHVFETGMVDRTRTKWTALGTIHDDTRGFVTYEEDD